MISPNRSIVRLTIIAASAGAFGLAAVAAAQTAAPTHDDPTNVAIFDAANT